MIKLEINNAEYIAQLEEARLSADNPHGYLFMDIIFSDPMFDESTFKMKDVRREPMRTYMTEDVARDLFEKLERYFYCDNNMLNN
ncbi:hypothetical protein [Proteus mirabilis]|uniref:hypothetical protein n=1 Tax=Proteus mirabilis TaxID=584 RepID=UPI00073C5982|nr:hypothetical protein [Proteus mirabilis]NAC32878.1 hypothetical protein [Escherichia coli]ARX08006.1 hypothetical protein AM405_03665 [Proteus mirabilis]ASB03345.1 hypothetical protein AM403_17390 [Proteus mirabilis]EKV9647584.1 hypothetical protein [Proteus mirabilis]ELA8072305.1 hypothetical protein [Proteus mirabilis]